MLYILFVTNCGNADVVDVVGKIEGSTYLQNIQSAWISLHGQDNTSKCKDDVAWQTLDETKATYMSMESSTVGNDLKQTAEHLHSIADSLPSSDTLFDIFLWPPEECDTSDYLLFLGALRRLKDWHNAKVTIFDPYLTPQTEMLQKFTSAAIHVRADDLIVDQDLPIWRGKVSIFDKNENKGLLVSGASLYKLSSDTPDLLFPLQEHTKKGTHFERARVGRMLEIMDEINLSTVPAIYKTPHKYRVRLYQKHPFSQVLMNYIQENDQTGMLTRLPVYPASRKSPSCADVGLSSKAWKENIITDIQYTQEPEEDLQDHYEFLYFIITSPDKYSSVENFVADAHLLHHPYSLNGSIATSIFHQSLCPTVRGDNDENCEKIDLCGLPLLNNDSLYYMERDVALLQRATLQRLLEEKQQNNESTVVDSGELTSLLSDIRLQYLDKLNRRLPNCSLNKPELKLDRNKQIYEAGENCYEWPERLVQQYLESQKRTLSRLQSSESMPMSSPLQPCDTSTTVDIQSLLRFFQPDGSAASDNLSPVRARRPSRSQSKLSTPDVGSPLLTSWPDSKDCSSHDVYYNNGKKSEKVNSHMNRIQEKLVKDETYSSCLSPIVLFPKPVKRKPNMEHAELRRSPRKKVPPRSGYDDNLRASLGEHRKQRTSIGRLSDSSTPLDERSKRRYSTPHPLPQNRRTSSASSLESFNRRQSDIGIDRTSTPVPRAVENLRRESDGDSFITPQGQGMKKESRSERHKRRLQDIVDGVLVKNGVTPSDPIFKSCSSRLFKVTKLFVMDLPNSRNLKDEMRKIAESQVKQVIEVDRNRQSANQRTRQK